MAVNIANVPATSFGGSSPVTSVGSGLVLSGGVLSVPGWPNAMAALASTALNISPSRITQSFTECDHGAVELASNVSGGTVSFPSNAVRGGVALLQTTATPSRYAGVIGAGAAAGVLINIKTDKWLYAARAKFSASDAASTHELGVAIGVGGIGTLTAVNAGAGFIISNGAASLQANNGGALTTVASSWTFDTTTSHDFVLIYDTVTLSAYVDTVLVASTTTLTNMPTNSAGQYMAFVSNGATAANRTLTLEKIGLWVDQGA